MLSLSSKEGRGAREMLRPVGSGDHWVLWSSGLSLQGHSGACGQPSPALHTLVPSASAAAPSSPGSALAGHRSHRTFSYSSGS